MGKHITSITIIVKNVVLDMDMILKMMMDSVHYVFKVIIIINQDGRKGL